MSTILDHLTRLRERVKSWFDVTPEEPPPPPLSREMIPGLDIPVCIYSTDSIRESYKWFAILYTALIDEWEKRHVRPLDDDLDDTESH